MHHFGKTNIRTGTKVRLYKSVIGLINNEMLTNWYLHRGREMRTRHKWNNTLFGYPYIYEMKVLISVASKTLKRPFWEWKNKIQIVCRTNFTMS